MCFQVDWLPNNEAERVINLPGMKNKDPLLIVSPDHRQNRRQFSAANTLFLRLASAVHREFVVRRRRSEDRYELTLSVRLNALSDSSCPKQRAGTVSNVSSEGIP